MLESIIFFYLIIDLVFYLFYLKKIEKQKLIKYRDSIKALNENLSVHQDQLTQVKTAKILIKCDKTNKRQNICDLIYSVIGIVTLFLIFTNTYQELIILLITIDILIIMTKWSEWNYILKQFNLN
mgnify:FL=1